MLSVVVTVKIVGFILTAAFAPPLCLLLIPCHITTHTIIGCGELTRCSILAHRACFGSVLFYCYCVLMTSSVTHKADLWWPRICGIATPEIRQSSRVLIEDAIIRESTLQTVRIGRFFAQVVVDLQQPLIHRVLRSWDLGEVVEEAWSN